jgi:RNA polymerase sigma-70 factor (ECF subfamily)
MAGVAPDDPVLMRAVAQGSESAFAALYDRHVGTVLAVASRLTSDRRLAEDVVQETFLAVWNRAETFDPAIAAFPAWLRTIARNRTIDRLRALGRRPDSGAFAVARDGEDEAEALERAVAAGTLIGGAIADPGPEVAIASLEVRTAIAAALAAMPAEERAAIILAYRDELSQSEIAERLGWPLGTVKTRTRRALQRLRLTLGPEYASTDLPRESTLSRSGRSIVEDAQR